MSWGLLILANGHDVKSAPTFGVKLSWSRVSYRRFNLHLTRFLMFFSLFFPIPSRPVLFKKGSSKNPQNHHGSRCRYSGGWNGWAESYASNSIKVNPSKAMVVNHPWTPLVVFHHQPGVFGDGFFFLWVGFFLFPMFVNDGGKNTCSPVWGISKGC